MLDIISTDADRLQGRIERITFHNPENGFCVLRVKIANSHDLVTVIGNMLNIASGEHVECVGQWHQDKVYGRQFKAQHLKTIQPTTSEEIEIYLASGCISGVGPSLAKLLVKSFGEEVFNVLENDPTQLLKLPGIGKRKYKKIIASFNEQKSMREIMLFLQTHGIGATRAAQIYKYYGNQAIIKISENPYQLANDLPGIGFKTVDAIAAKLGIDASSMERACAGVRYVLQELCQHGDCATPYTNLLNKTVELLGIDENIIIKALTQEMEAKKIISENINDTHCVFPAVLHNIETQVAKRLLRLQTGKLPWQDLNINACIPRIEKQSGITLAASQLEAIHTLLAHKLAIVTGGPGVGKTTIVNTILKLLQTKALNVALCAPTGRAAKRLSEITGVGAKTIHRLLQFSPDTYSFNFDQDNPLKMDVIIIDEASMIDIYLLHHLLKALPLHAAVYFIGDVDQLPSVGPGAILMDMITAGVIPTLRLTEIFRQANDSRIITNAHRINKGEMPLANESESSDFYTIYTDSAFQIKTQLLEIVATRIPKYLNCNPLTDIQVLTPMHRGELGSVNLNNELQRHLNAHTETKVIRSETTYLLGDRVIQTVNNYNKEVFNGDIGFITHINTRDQLVKVTFDHRTVEYTFGELNELNLAYAISIHKSQGSEFPVVVIPVTMQHHVLLARNLLYTAVTRGKEMVILIGEKRAIGMAINNNNENKRLTNLAQRLATPNADFSHSAKLI